MSNLYTQQINILFNSVFQKFRIFSCKKKKTEDMELFIYYFKEKRDENKNYRYCIILTYIPFEIQT